MSALGMDRGGGLVDLSIDEVPCAFRAMPLLLTV